MESEESRDESVGDVGSDVQDTPLDDTANERIDSLSVVYGALERGNAESAIKQAIEKQPDETKRALRLAQKCIDGTADATTLTLAATDIKHASFGASVSHVARGISSAAGLVASDRTAAARSIVRGAMQAPLETLIQTVVLETLSRDAEHVRFELIVTLTAGAKTQHAEMRRDLARHFEAHATTQSATPGAVRHVQQTLKKSDEEAERFVAEFAAEWTERSERFAWVRNLTDAHVARIIRNTAFLRKFRGMRGTAANALNRNSSSAKKDPGKIRPLFSNIVAGKYPAHQNYRCRLFQVDVVVLPFVEVEKDAKTKKWKLVRTKKKSDDDAHGKKAVTQNALLVTCVCVGTRFALAEFIRGPKKGSKADASEVLEAFKKIFGTILATFDERLAWESAAVSDERGGCYNEANFASNVPVPAYTAERALIRPLPPVGTYRETWLSALEMLTEHATERREVNAPWERTKPRVIFMSDAGDFSKCALWLQRPQNVKAFWDKKFGRATSIPFEDHADHPEWQKARVFSWCVVNKSAVRRLSMQVVERFHRTLRAMLSLYYKLHGLLPTRPPTHAEAVKRALRSYNDSIHRTMQLPPVELWRGLPRGTCAGERLAYGDGPLQASKQKVTFASLEDFGRGVRVEALAGKDDMATNKQQVHRTPGLLIEHKNHCTLELRQSGVAWLLEAELKQISRVSRPTLASDEEIAETARKCAATQDAAARIAALQPIMHDAVAARYAARRLRCTGVTDAVAMWHARRVARKLIGTYPNVVVEPVGAWRRGLTDDLVVRLLVIEDQAGLDTQKLKKLLGQEYVECGQDGRTSLYVVRTGPGDFFRLVEIQLTQTEKVKVKHQSLADWIHRLVMTSAPTSGLVAPSCKAQLETPGIQLHKLRTPHEAYMRLGFGHLACARDEMSVDALRAEQDEEITHPHVEAEPGATAVLPNGNGPMGDCGTGPEGNAFYHHDLQKWVYVWHHSPVPPWMLRREV